MAASAAFLAGWIPTLGLALNARRKGLLIAAQTLGPLLVAFAMWLFFVILEEY
jgi:hypothetical protein